MQCGNPEEEITNGLCWGTTKSTDGGKSAEQEVNLPHGSWLQCSPARKAVIILWPAHVGIHRAVRSAFSWLAEPGQDLFVPWLVLFRLQLSSKHFGSLFSSIFVLWKCVYVFKWVFVTLVKKTNKPPFLQMASLPSWLHFACWKPNQNLKCSLWGYKLRGDFFIWWNIPIAHLELILHKSFPWLFSSCVVIFLRGYNVIITWHLWNVVRPSETLRAETREGESSQGGGNSAIVCLCKGLG